MTLKDMRTISAASYFKPKIRLEKNRYFITAIDPRHIQLIINKCIVLYSSSRSINPVAIAEKSPEIPAIEMNSNLFPNLIFSEISLVTNFHQKSIAKNMLRKIPTIWANKRVTLELYPSVLNPMSKSVIEKIKCGCCDK